MISFADHPALQPYDRFNRDLVQQVHPGDWRNPELRARYHLVVIGAGTGGLVSAGAAAMLGAKVLLVEKHLMGGDCLNFGCVPSKALIASARSWADAKRSQSDFGGPAVAEDGDFAVAMERLRRLRSEIGHHDSAQRFADLGADVVLGEARFTARNSVQVDGKEVRFRRAIIATGAKPWAPPIPGLEQVRHYNNETIFSLTELPASLAIIGAGPIGCEMAQSFARFGSRITVFDIATQALGRDDVDAAAVIERKLQSEGVRLALNTAVDQVEQQGDSVVLHVEGEPKTFDALLLATGRRANTDELGLDAAGVAIEEGRVSVDDFLRTSNRRIYAVGDVASPYQFTHVADAQARIAVQNALFFGRARNSRLVVPWCTYTSPEVAHVGLTQADAEKQGIAIDTQIVPLEEVDRATLDGTTDGFLKVYLKRGSGRILGATLVAERAGDMIGELALAISHAIPVGKISSTIHPYPTVGEITRKAADNWRRDKLTPLMQSVLAAYFRFLR